MRQCVSLASLSIFSQDISATSNRRAIFKDYYNFHIINYSFNEKHQFHSSQQEFVILYFPSLSCSSFLATTENESVVLAHSEQFVVPFSDKTQWKCWSKMRNWPKLCPDSGAASIAGCIWREIMSQRDETRLSPVPKAPWIAEKKCILPFPNTKEYPPWVDPSRDNQIKT